MRTTVTLDPDTEVLLRRLMRVRGLSFKEALNMGFRPEIRWDKAVALASALEDEELVRKMELRK